jgi:hypothetical protein
MRTRTVLYGMIAVLALAGCGSGTHVRPINALWAACEGGRCAAGDVRSDPALVSVDIARHYCAALDRFDGYLARDLRRSGGAVTAGFAYAGGATSASARPDQLDYVTEMIIPAGHDVAQQVQTAAAQVPRTCASGLNAKLVDIDQPASGLSVYTFTVHPVYHNTDLTENFSVAYFDGILIVAKDTGGGAPSSPAISQDAVECSAAGGPLTNDAGNAYCG